MCCNIKLLVIDVEYLLDVGGDEHDVDAADAELVEDEEGVHSSSVNTQTHS